MSTHAKRPGRGPLPLKKCPTGIPGLDEITGGGLPKGRTTIVCGGPGCGKTMLGIEFLVRGAMELNEPGVLMAFEETPRDIATNVASLGFDIQALARKKKLYLDFLSVEPSQIKESGEYDLEGLFIRLAAISNLKKICSEHFEAKCKIEVIDLLKKPALARDHQIIAIPTLVRSPYQSAKSSGICRTPSAS
jgi:KaiC/GvpD/RAD55 family RecA-like ATPase